MSCAHNMNAAELVRVALTLHDVKEPSYHMAQCMHCKEKIIKVVSWDDGKIEQPLWIGA